MSFLDWLRTHFPGQKLTAIHGKLFEALPDFERPPYRTFHEWTKGGAPKSAAVLEYLAVLSDRQVIWHDATVLDPIRGAVLDFKKEVIDHD